MRVVGVIQARWGSEFLPGKVGYLLAGKPMLEHVCVRALAAEMLDEVVVATPWSDRQLLWPLVPYGASLHSPNGVDESDLVTRYLLTADACDADVVVRLCADNPCLSPHAIDQLVTYYLDHPCIFLSNTVLRVGEQLVDGLGAEVFSYSRLKWLHRKLPMGTHRYREHPHQYFHEQGFAPIGLEENLTRPTLRLDVDNLGDAEFVGAIYAACYPKNPLFGIDEILGYLHETQQAQRLAL